MTPTQAQPARSKWLESPHSRFSYHHEPALISDDNAHKTAATRL